MSDAQLCDRCGKPFETNGDGTTFHSSGDPDEDFDLDEDHVPYETE